MVDPAASWSCVSDVMLVFRVRMHGASIVTL
jgi:hypothetical protein